MWRGRERDDDWERDSRDQPDWRQDSLDEPSWPGDDRPRRRRDPRGGPGWQRDDDGWQGEPGTETMRRRREAAPADPWAQNAADTGMIPMTWQPPETDTGSWRSSPAAVGRARPTNPNRRRDGGTNGRLRELESGPSDTATRMGGPSGTGTRMGGPGETSGRVNGRRRVDDDAHDDSPLDPEVYRREPGTRSDGANWPLDDPREEDWRRDLVEPAVGDAVTEVRQRIDPSAWRREQPPHGAASYRERTTGDWRRELAAESGGLVDGESRRFGTQDFVPFKPVGSAAVPAAPVSAPQADPVSVVRERWEDAPDNVWPPRRPTGYQTNAGAYERRPVGDSFAAGPNLSNNLLEPDEDDLEEDTGGPLAAVGYTVIWYGVPVVLFVLYMLVLNGDQQAHALSTLADAAPQFGLSLVLSMVVAVALRWASGSWKAASVGLAAAVMGGGLATVLSSVITGNSLS
ncbi:MAG TPA: hypothetical protein VFH03_20090 [Actinoplanes sp.]|nr:hypothetical protein [Actinoplanes sp.]